MILKGEYKLKTHVTLQERLKDLRVEKGLSQDDLADIEIYIDGIAGQDFQAIQAVMNAHHEKIVKNSNLTEMIFLLHCWKQTM